MKMKKKDYIDMFFGKTAKVRFKRIVILLAGFSIFLILFFNISYDKKNGLQWIPAGKVNVNINK